MNVNFYVTCIADISKRAVWRKTLCYYWKNSAVMLSSLKNKAVVDNLQLNSGYTKQALPGMKNLVETFEVNDYPNCCPCRFLCICNQKLLLTISLVLVNLDWAERARKSCESFL